MPEYVLKYSFGEFEKKAREGLREILREAEEEGEELTRGEVIEMLIWLFQEEMQDYGAVGIMIQQRRLDEYKVFYLGDEKEDKAFGDYLRKFLGLERITGIR